MRRDVRVAARAKLVRHHAAELVRSLVLVDLGFFKMYVFNLSKNGAGLRTLSESLLVCKKGLEITLILRIQS